MADVDERQQRLFAALDQASSALSGVTAETRDASAGAVELVERVVAFARLVVEETDPDFLSDSAMTLESAATNIAVNIGAVPANPRAYADVMLNALTAFPVSRGRDMEQASREAAATFQRSASQRLSAVQNEIATFENEVAQKRAAIEEQLANLRSSLDAAGDDAKANIASYVSDFQAKLTEYEQSMALQRQSLDQTLTRHSEAFSTTQGERAEEFQAELAKARDDLSTLHERVAAELQQHLDDIRRIHDDAVGMQGALCQAGTAERYGDEAKEQKRVADTMRRLTVALAIGAIGMAVFAAVHNVRNTPTVVSKLGVSAVFAALATYTARQSGRHRVREERARNLQLELTAFAPFIEPLPDEQQSFERVIMTRKTFGQISALPEAEGDHSFGLGPLGPITDILKRTTASS